MAREIALFDEIAALANEAGSVDLRVLKERIEANQVHFETVAEALRSFGKGSTS